ncbi:MAG: hypothetical protein ACR2IE_12160 [Candidatus Sumerlaeaceae bacterium]
MEEQDKEQQPQDTPGEPDMRARLQEKLKEFEAKFRDRVKDLDETVRTEFRDAIPPQVTAHLQKSKEEFLLAVRGIVDRQLDKARKETPSEPSTAPPPPPSEQPPASSPPPPPSPSRPEDN